MNLEEVQDCSRRIAAVVRSFHSSEQRIEELLSVTRGQSGILNFLDRNPKGVNSGELARMLGVGTGRIGNALKEMERKGTITRRVNAKDNRCVIVKITPKGRAEVQARKDEFYRNIGFVLEKVGCEKVSAMLETMEEISRAQEEYLKIVSKEKEGGEVE